MSIVYLALRAARRLLPAPLTRRMLEFGVILKPGLETSEPEQAAERYRRALGAEGGSLSGKDVLLFGYGGGFGVGVHLLRGGAATLTLCDRYARPSARRNARWFAEEPDLFRQVGGVPEPDGRRLRLLHDDIRAYAGGRQAEFDLVLSSSVLEHVDDVEGIAAALAQLTRPNGVHLHYIDVRDHYFRLPFEMLTYSEPVWRRLLNPGTNLNRMRPWQYVSVFRQHFSRVSLHVVQAETAAFRRARNRIRPEFVSGDEAWDSAGVVLLTAAGRP